MKGLAIDHLLKGCSSLLYCVVQPLDTASARMQTSTFGKSKSLMQTYRESSVKELWAGIGASLLLTSNPAIQVNKQGPLYESITAKYPSLF